MIWEKHVLVLWILFVLAIASNVLQLLSVDFSALANTNSMISEFRVRAVSNFEGFLWSSECVYQNMLLKEFFVDGEGDVVFSGINPVFFAEILVLILVTSLVAIVVYSNPNCKPDWVDRCMGIFFGGVLFTYDFFRYIDSSVTFFSKNVTPKGLYTWSSYCFQGDVGWLFDAFGYLFMYLLVSLGISIFSKSVRVLLSEDLSGMDVALNTIGRVYTWLPYFSYLGFAGWVTFTGVNRAGAGLYQQQALLITGFILIVFAACLTVLVTISRRDTFRENTIFRELLSPFGTRSINILIRIVLPPLTMLAITNESIKSLLQFNLYPS